MVDLIFAILCLMIGVGFFYSSYKTSKTKDVKLNIHKIINLNTLKNKEQYLRTYCKWNYILGGIAIVEGTVGVTSFYVSSISFAFETLNIVFVLALFLYMFRIISMLCKG